MYLFSICVSSLYFAQAIAVRLLNTERHRAVVAVYWTFQLLTVLILGRKLSAAFVKAVYIDQLQYK